MLVKSSKRRSAKKISSSSSSSEQRGRGDDRSGERSRRIKEETKQKLEKKTARSRWRKKQILDEAKVRRLCNHLSLVSFLDSEKKFGTNSLMNEVMFGTKGIKELRNNFLCCLYFFHSHSLSFVLFIFFGDVVSLRSVLCCVVLCWGDDGI